MRRRRANGSYKSHSSPIEFDCGGIAIGANNNTTSMRLPKKGPLVVVGGAVAPSRPLAKMDTQSLRLTNEVRCQTRRSADKKWLKSPHNKFKAPPPNDTTIKTTHKQCIISAGSQRRAKKIVVSPLFLHTLSPQNRKLKSIVFIFEAAIMILLLSANNPPLASSSETPSSGKAIARTTTQQLASQLKTASPSTRAPNSTIPSSSKATYRRAANVSSANGLKAFDNEDEVDLLRPAQVVAQHANSHPHIYKIRAAPFNGKLALPSASSIRHIQIGDALAAHKTLPQLRQRNGDAAKAVPLTTTTTTLDTSLPQETTTSGSTNFGARAGAANQTAPLASRRAQQKQQQQQLQSQAHEHCKQPSEEAREMELAGGSSIAASSPTLRLTGPNRTMTQLIGSQPELSSLSALPAPSLAAAHSAARFRGQAGEVEEIPESSLKSDLSLQSARTKSSLIAARASATSSANNPENQRTGNNNLRLTSFAESGMATERAALNSDLDEGAGSESRPTSGGAESIMSLIDEYDSKIITNKTKAQLSCDSGEMILRLNFSEPFKGIVYPDHNRLSPCRFFGDGHHNYELRLPLRGCGTRQAAPRVFVNDVIVRFHKTLELEEDEVKTLICRYPPPLTPVPLESFGQPSSINSSRPTGGEPSEPLDGQFEFVDPHSGRVRPEAGSSGHIETISENLVVAPSSGQQFAGQQQNLNPYQTGTSQWAQSNGNSNNNNNNRLNANIRQRPSGSSPGDPVDLFNQRDSFAGNGANAGAGSEPSAQQNYFERLSSIELLFLISSLMFLVLLTLGLVGSFYCFRRQANQGQRASAILKRKRRYLSPAAGPTLQQYQSQRRQHPVSASPSPGSDLSGRGLLAGSSSSLSAAGHMGYLYNRAYQPEPPSGNLQRYLAAAAGGSHYGSQFVTSADPQRPMSIRGAARPANDAGHLRRQQAPVLGRRDTIYGYAGGLARGQARHLSPVSHAGGQHQLHKLAQAKLRSSTFAKSQTELQPDRPLLLFNSDTSHYAGPQPDHHYRGRPLMRAKLQQVDTGGPTLVSAKYALVNKSRGEQHHQHGGRRAQQVAEQEALSDRQQLWRAKSLSSVQQVSDDMRAIDGRPYPVGGTLSRHEHANSNQHRHHYLAPVHLSEKELRYGGYDAKQRGGLAADFSASSGGSCSESEPEPDNNQPKLALDGQSQFQQRPKPKLLLKSIEDSYITNFTEIHEQEYVKRDSMRPLSMAAWRAMQPKINQSGGKNGGDPDDGDDDGGRFSSEKDREEEEAEEEREEDQRYPSAQTNLRSLTELDVNFSRSPESAKSSLRPAISMDQVPNMDDRNQSGRARVVEQQPMTGTSNQPPERSISVPDVGTGKQVNQATRNNANTSATSSSSAFKGHQSPDLILSPDYEYHRLELESSASQTSPHNSVSYV